MLFVLGLMLNGMVDEVLKVNILLLFLFELMFLVDICVIILFIVVFLGRNLVKVVVGNFGVLLLIF